MLPLLIPLAVIQLALFGVALWDLIKRKRVTGGNKLVWGVVIVLISFIGPILYLIVGRKED
ncbi:MAG: Negative regulatory protein YxlE [Chloroflexi bacterium]|nr:Negative regulatory protein YxlE [Chloroflexota bacterium]